MPATPNRGFPYPARSATPALGWSDIQSLAEAVDLDMAARAADLNTRPKGILARGRRGSNTGGFSGETGIVRIDDVPITGGRLYRIWAQGSVDNATTRVIPLIRYTTDGSTPTTASTTLEECIFNSVASGTTGGTFHISGFYTPGSNEALSVLLTASAGSGILVFGVNAEHCDIVIEDMGIDPGDTGVDI